MADAHVITALARKRGQLAGEVEAVQERLQELLSDLGKIDDAIRVFDPDYRVAGIRLIEFRARSSTKRGEIARIILDAIREAGQPISARDIVSRIMQAKKMDESDKRLLKHMLTKVNVALRHHRKKGALRSMDGPDVHLLWRVAE